MYGKIRLVHGWEEACVARAEAAWGDARVADLLAAKLSQRWQPAAGDLADLIDDHPIHDWLQATLNRAETSLAATVAALSSHGEGAVELLRGASFDHGREVARHATRPPKAGDGALAALAAILATWWRWTAGASRCAGCWRSTAPTGRPVARTQRL